MFWARPQALPLPRSAAAAHRDGPRNTFCISYSARALGAGKRPALVYASRTPLTSRQPACRVDVLSRSSLPLALDCGHVLLGPGKAGAIGVSPEHTDGAGLF